MLTDARKPKRHLETHETTLYAPVKRYLEAHGFTVKGEVCGCDLVALRGEEPPIVVVGELKLASEDEAGTQRSLGTVVGRRDGAVGEEDEHVSPASLDHLLQLAAGAVGRRGAEQDIELGVELVAIDAQGGVGKRRVPAADRAGLLQQRAQAGREGGVAGVDGILGVADQMGEADLVVGPAQPICAARRSETQKSGRASPRNSSTTSLPRLLTADSKTLCACWMLWNP